MKTEHIRTIENGPHMSVRVDPDAVYSLIPDAALKDTANRYVDEAFARADDGIEIGPDTETAAIAQIIPSGGSPGSNVAIAGFHFDKRTVQGPKLEMMLTALEDPELETGEGDMLYVPISLQETKGPSEHSPGHEIYEAVIMPRAQLEAAYERKYGRPPATAMSASIESASADVTTGQHLG